MSKQPNVLFLISDQHNAKCLGHEGHSQVQTPHMDALASQGTRFSRCTTANPICTPSRTSFLSGQYCHNHGYYGLSGPNPGGLPNIFGHFRGHGYRTAAIGKIHCPEYWVEDACDVFHETCSCSREGRSKAYIKHLKDRDLLELEDHGGYPEHGATTGGRQNMDGRPSVLPYESSQEGWIAGTGMQFIKDCHAEDKPWIMQCSFPRPHQVTAPAQEFWDLYKTEDMILPPSCDADLTGKAPHLLATRDHWRSGKWALFEPKNFIDARLRKLHGYLGAISQVDAAVGQLLQTLDQLGIAENTIVIYTSDHGDYACEFDIMEKAPGICADAITRIPFIWRGPGIAAGQQRDELVESIDLSQTVCDLAGLPALQSSDGTSLRPLLMTDGDASTWTKEVGITEFAWSKSIRKGNWRLVKYAKDMFPDEYPDGFGELYELGDDPYEMKNRYFDEDVQGVVRELEQDLYDWLVTTTRPTTILGVSAPEPGDPQVRERFTRQTLADGKLNPEWIAERFTSNYL